MTWLVMGISVAAAQGLQEQAEQLMNLDFSLDEIRGRVSRSKQAVPRTFEGYDYEDAYVEEAYEAPYSAYAVVERLPLEPNSDVRSVTVFRDRAMVTRVLEVPLAAGLQAVTFEGLPWSLLEAGIEAGVEAGSARIVGVEVVSASRELLDDDASLASTRADAEAAIDALGLVRDRIESLLAERTYLRTALVPPGATSGRTVAQVESGMRFVAATEARISKGLRGQQVQADELADELHPLLVKLQDPHASGQPVQIELEVQRAGPVRLVLEYAVPGAGWTPAYNARLDLSTSEVDLDVYGVVQQATAEDWTDAEILLSTADAVGATSVQPLQRWTLGRTGSAGTYALELGAGVVTAAPQAPSAGGVVDSDMQADVQRGGVVILAIPGKRTIRGDGSAQRLPVGSQKLSATSSLHTVPKLQPAVSRQARVTYDGKLPLLPGPVSTFVGKDFVGSHQLDTVIPGETLELGFGTDDHFWVTRELVERMSERAGRRATRYTFRFQTTVANHGDTDAEITLVDQIPLSDTSDIEVEVLELSGGAHNGQDGQITWTPTVAAHEQAVFQLAFSVVIPDHLAGLAAELNQML